MSPEAFKLFFFELYPELASLSVQLLHDHPAARQLTIDAFFLLWSRRTEFDNGKRTRNFLYLAVRNSCIQWLKCAAAGEPETFCPPPASLPAPLLQQLLDFAAKS